MSLLMHVRDDMRASNGASMPDPVIQIDSSRETPKTSGTPLFKQNSFFAYTIIALGADEFFVLGDNRRVSADSRLWGILPRKDIVGRVFLRLYPLSEIGVLPGEARYGN